MELILGKIILLPKMLHTESGYMKKERRVNIYCNSCGETILKDDVVYCSQCNAPLHKSCANHCLSCGKVLCDTCSLDNKFYCEGCYKPEKKFTKIRRSHIEQYLSCPYSFYLQLILGKETPMGSYAQLGVIVHHIIDGMSHHSIDVNEAIERLCSEVKEWNDNTDLEYSIITEELLSIGIDCLNNFYSIRPLFGSNYTSEENIIFSINEELPDISCTLDRIEFLDDSIHIHDWKTGKPMSGKKLTTDLQPPLYIWSVKSKYGKLPQTFNLHYLRNNKTITYKLTDKNKVLYEVKTPRKLYTLDVLKQLKVAEDVLKGITKGIFNIPEKIEWRCNSMCYYGLTNQCSGSQTEQWKIMNKKYNKQRG